MSPGDIRGGRGDIRGGRGDIRVEDPENHILYRYGIVTVLTQFHQRHQRHTIFKAQTCSVSKINIGFSGQWLALVLEEDFLNL